MSPRPETKILGSHKELFRYTLRDSRLPSHRVNHGWLHTILPSSTPCSHMHIMKGISPVTRLVLLSIQPYDALSLEINLQEAIAKCSLSNTNSVFQRYVFLKQQEIPVSVPTKVGAYLRNNGKFDAVNIDDKNATLCSFYSSHFETVLEQNDEKDSRKLKANRCSDKNCYVKEFSMHFSTICFSGSKYLWFRLTEKGSFSNGIGSFQLCAYQKAYGFE
uniref:SFRICE_020679 n=1 Tax=Spodoptera frugiperda TaxID=7108 RepID=A0A2H1WCI6_SPOFR